MINITTFKNSLDKNKHLTNMYNDTFYEAQMTESYISAKKYVSILSEYHKPTSVVDVGCGRGTWLKAFKEAGDAELIGFDGIWNSQEEMIDKTIVFYPVDLNMPIKQHSDRKFDLAISLEVAEHLKMSSSSSFINTLVDLSNIVLFSAAYTKQGGTNHINEQPHSYWANIFSSYDYVPFDLFRPIVWGDAEIPYWYQQNVFLYVRRNSIQYEKMVLMKLSPINNLAFMDCIHPALFTIQTDYLFATKQLISKIIPKPLLSIAIRTKQLLFKNRLS